jgi:hypothetical protein
MDQGNTETGFSPEQQAYLQSLIPQQNAATGPYKGALAGLTKGPSAGGKMTGGLMGGFGGGLIGALYGKKSQGGGVGALSKFAQTQAGLQRGYVTDATAEAQRSLMEGFRQAYAQRAAGIAGSYGLQSDQLVSEMASQGLDPSIVRRMLASQRGSSLQQLGEAQAEGAAGYYDTLAKLQKGTGGELAAISQAETEQYLAPQIAKISGDAAKSAARRQAAGNILGGFLSAI